MKTYSAFVDRILRAEDLLQKLLPKEPLNFELLREIRAADDAAISGQAAGSDALSSISPDKSRR